MDREHTRPDGASDELVAACGTFSEAPERIERARGALYEFHQLVGGADAALDGVVDACATPAGPTWPTASATS